MLRQPFGGQRFALDPSRQLGDRCEGDVVVVCGQRADSVALRTKRVDARAAVICPAAPDSRAWPARPFGSIATLRGPVRRSRSGAIDARQLAAAIWRSAGVIVTCASFSASANVVGVTGGPDTGPVPNVGGAPAVVEDAGVNCFPGRRGMPPPQQSLPSVP